MHSTWFTAGGHVVESNQVRQPVRVEAAHADGPDTALFAQLGYGPPGPVVVVQRLVDEIQVQIVQAQPVQGLLEGRLSPLIAGI